MLLAKSRADSKVLRTYNMANEFAVRRAKGRRSGKARSRRILVMVNILNFTYKPWEPFKKKIRTVRIRLAFSNSKWRSTHISSPFP